MTFEGNIKGTHIINVINYIKKKRGVIGLTELFELVYPDPGQRAKVTPETFKEGDWYPYELYMSFLDAADNVAGVGDMGRCYEIGYQTIQHLGHLSYLVKAPSIFEVVEKATANWNKVYDFGSLEMVEKGEKRVVIRYKGFPRGFHQRCKYFHGSLTATLEMCGLDGTVTETKCAEDDYPYCEYVLEWK